MYPLTVDEFLSAVGEAKALDLLDLVPLPDYALPILYKLFHTYTLIGGMPEIVKIYAGTKDITSLSHAYQSLLTSYYDDVGKYARNETKNRIIRHCIENAPYETGKRIKFAGFGNSNYKSREVMEALDLLEKARLLFLFYPSTSVSIPVVPDKKKRPRLQFFDTGILNFVSNLQQYYFQYDDLFAFYKGILAEQIVGQEFIANDLTTEHKPQFWVREKKQSSAQVDFLFQYNEYVLPVEVKSGKAGTLRSLHQFINHCDHHYAVRLYSGDLQIDNIETPEGKQFYLLSLPYFLTGKLKEYLDWFFKEIK